MMHQCAQGWPYSGDHGLMSRIGLCTMLDCDVGVSKKRRFKSVFIIFIGNELSDVISHNKTNN